MYRNLRQFNQFRNFDVGFNEEDSCLAVEGGIIRGKKNERASNKGYGSRRKNMEIGRHICNR